MSNKVKYVDYAILGALFLLTSYGVFRHFADDFVLTINFYLGVLMVIGAGIYKLSVKPVEDYFVLTIFFLATFSLINFTPEVVNGTILYTDNELAYNTLGFNPIVFIVLVAYCFINRKLLKAIFKRSEEEVSSQSEVKTSFYYNKFKDLGDEEFNEIFSNINKYPVDAQAALLKIADEKKL